MMQLNNRGFRMRLFGHTSVMLILLSLSLNTARSTSTLNHKCSDTFVGEVRKIADSKAPFSSLMLSREDVIFDLEGEQRGERQVNVLKNGPVKFEVGKKYKISLNDNLICDIALVSSN